MPVKIMAMPCSLAAVMTSSSRTEPPGWMMARTPAAAAASTPSRKGKKASLASTLPWVSRPSFWAFRTAICEAKTRLVCPAPMPMVARFLASTMALDLTVLAIFQAKSRSCSSSGAGSRALTVFRFSLLMMPLSHSWTSRPPWMLVSCHSWARWPSLLISRTRMFGFCASTCSASSS